MIVHANEKVGHFNKTSFEVLERHAPVKEKKVRQWQCPFVDQEIKELMEERDLSHGVACASGAVVDWDHYFWYRNEVKRRLRDAEKKH